LCDVAEPFKHITDPEEREALEKRCQRSALGPARRDEGPAQCCPSGIIANDPADPDNPKNGRCVPEIVFFATGFTQQGEQTSAQWPAKYVYFFGDSARTMRPVTRDYTFEDSAVNTTVGPRTGETRITIKPSALSLSVEGHKTFSGSGGAAPGYHANTYINVCTPRRTPRQIYRVQLGPLRGDVSVTESGGLGGAKSQVNSIRAAISNGSSSGGETVAASFAHLPSAGNRVDAYLQNYSSPEYPGIIFNCFWGEAAYIVKVGQDCGFCGPFELSADFNLEIRAELLQPTPTPIVTPTAP